MNIGFDIGGTNTRVAALTDAGIGPILRMSTKEDPEQQVIELSALITKIAAGAKIETCVGGIPGTPKKDGTLFRIPNLPAWDGFPFAPKLSQNIGAAVVLEHDASLGALGEAVYGAGKGAQSLAYFGIGTGVGVGRVVAGRIDSPVTGFEAGHQIVAQTQSLDDLVSGRAITARSGMHPSEAPRALYDELTPLLAAAVYNTILHWQPDVFILGGSLMNEENGYRLVDVVSALKKLPSYFESLPKVCLAGLKGDSNLWGARAMLH